MTQDDKLEQLMRDYASNLELPGRELDATVLGSMRDRPPGLFARLTWARPMMLSPVLVAATVLLAAGAGFFAALRWAPAVPAPIAVTADSPGEILVRFRISAPGASRVSLAGSFNSWDASATLLTPENEAGVWTVTVPLAPGQYEYLFVVDGESWLPDPGAHAQVDDGFGNTNSVIVVGPRGVIQS